MKDSKLMKKSVFAFAALLGMTALAGERVGDWWVNMPAAALKAMSTSERTCADRANKSFDDRNYRSAANEWKRFNTEFLTTANEEALAWASMLQALSLDRAMDKFKAIELYSETMELYPDSKASAVALYFRGRSQEENGQLRKALEDYQAIVDNELWRTHPVGYTALNRLAREKLARGKLDKAMADWQTMLEMNRDVNRCEWDSAKNALNIVATLSDMEGKLLEAAGDEEKKPDQRRNQLRNWRNWIWDIVWRNDTIVRLYFENHLGGAKNVRDAEMAWLKKMSVAFSKTATPIFKAAGSDWEMLMIEFDTVKALMPKNIDKMINKVGAEVRKNADPQLRNDRALAFIGTLNGLGRTKEAKLFLDLVQDPIRRAWTAVGIGWREKNMAYVIENLAPIESLPDPNESNKAKREHAKACEAMSDWDGAIKLYEEAPEPPGTLWRVANCHRSAGRKPRAQGVLDEICSMFPNDAPNAMLTKGDWYNADGDKKNAIGCYRRILGHAEWKKAGAASQAHQRLEAFGIGTGGAVLNEVH